MKRTLLLCSLLALGLYACEQKPKQEETTATTAAASPAEPVPATDKAGTTTATEPTAQKAPEPADDLPTVVDFEDEAEQKITSANLETELVALEKEIGTK
jgi:hypothetical protein